MITGVKEDEVLKYLLSPYTMSEADLIPDLINTHMPYSISVFVTDSLNRLCTEQECVISKLFVSMT